MPVVVAAVPCFALDARGSRIILVSGEVATVNNIKGIYSIRKASDFALLATQARISKDSDFLIRYLDNHQGYARLGIAISKKNVKNAVKRNRIRRIIRETFRKYRLRLPSRDYMISYRGAQDQIDASMLNKKLIRFWGREAIHCPE